MAKKDEAKEVLYIIVAGGGKLGYNLTKVLMEENHEVLLVERDKARYDELSSELGGNIHWGDAAESDVLKAIGTNRANVMVAVTGDDATNLVVCQMAKIMYMTPRTIARVANPKNQEIFTSLGVDNIINATKIVNSIIEKEVDAGMIIPLLDIKGGKIQIIQTDILSNSPAIGKAIKDLKLPDDCLIVSIMRGDDVILPKGNNVLEAGDTILVVTTEEKKNELREVI